jgi:hypothetical protein
MATKFFQRLSAVSWLLYPCLAICLAAVAGVFLAEVTLHPKRRLLSSGDGAEAREIARIHNSNVSDIIVTAQDGAILSAWNIRPANGNGNTVILLHGLADNRLGMLGYAELLVGHGFDVLLPDARAHGISGGSLATFGLLESDDIHRWLDWLEQNQHPDCIFGLGESMGAALLLQSLRSEKRFCAVAAESPFATFREIGYDRIGQFFHTGPWLGRTALRPIIEFAFVYSRLRYDFDFERASPQNVVASTNVPVFLIHAQNDSNIPVRHSRLIAARNPSVSLWEVANTDHCGAVGTHPTEFDERLSRWFVGHAKTGSQLATRAEE